MEAPINEYRNLEDNQRTVKTVSRLDLEFHTAIFNAAHHDRLYRAWEILRSQIHSFLIYTWAREDFLNKTMMTSWEGDHQIFLDLIMERDVEKALRNQGAC